MCVGSTANAYDNMAAAADVQSTNQRALNDAAATDALNRGNQKAAAADMKTGQTVGAQGAGYAGSDVDPGSGTPLQMMADTRVMGAYNKAIIENSATREAWGYQTKGLADYMQGQLNAFGASNQRAQAQNQNEEDWLKTGESVASSLGK